LTNGDGGSPAVTVAVVLEVVVSVPEAVSVVEEELHAAAINRQASTEYRIACMT
jgi:hypothetical protein